MLVRRIKERIKEKKGKLRKIERREKRERKKESFFIRTSRILKLQYYTSSYDHIVIFVRIVIALFFKFL